MRWPRLVAVTALVLACGRPADEAHEGGAQREPEVPGIETGLATTAAIRDVVRAFGTVLAEGEPPEVRDARTALAEAEARFREAVRLQPNYADAEFNLGNALARQGRASEAIPYLREAVRDDPRSPEAHAGLGTALLNMGSFQEAALQLSEAVRLKPDFAVAHYNLARALELQGSASSASDHYQRAFTLDPDLRAGAANR